MSGVEFLSALKKELLAGLNKTSHHKQANSESQDALSALEEVLDLFYLAGKDNLRPPGFASTHSQWSLREELALRDVCEGLLGRLEQMPALSKLYVRHASLSLLAGDAHEAFKWLCIGAYVWGLLSGRR